MPIYQPTRIQFLVKNTANGNYYAAKKVGKFMRRKSLKTTAETIAKAKLNDALVVLQNRYGQIGRDSHDITLGQCSGAFMIGEESRTDVGPSGLKYRRETLKMLTRTWPKWESVLARKVTLEDLGQWSKRAKEHYSPSRFNGLLDTMRGILDVAVKQHVIPRNLGYDIKRLNVPLNAPDLPSSKQFQSLLALLQKKSRSNRASVVVQLLSFTGLRIGNARLLETKHVDLIGGWIHVPPFKFAKTFLKIPILPEAKELFERLVKEAPSSGLLLPIADPRKALANGCKELGIWVTPHTLRHYFTTRCLECGVDVKTVAGWLGHKDGGALLLKRYAHLRDEHSKKMAEKVTF